MKSLSECIAHFQLDLGGFAQSRPFERGLLIGIAMDVQTDGNGNPILQQFSEDGFVDMTFRLANLVDDGQYYRFHVAAAYNNLTVGMNVVLVKGIQGGFTANMDVVKEHVYRQGVRFLRSGPESDRLIAAVAELYGSNLSRSRMVEEETFTAFALHQGSMNMACEPAKLKIFGRDGEPFDENAYYESFFNVDIPDKLVFWNEKDPDYRNPLLRALAAR